MDKLTILVKRLAKINVDIKLSSNYPWIYLDSINNKKVLEKTSDSNHGFNIAWANKELVLTNTKEMFDLIRQMR